MTQLPLQPLQPLYRDADGVVRFRENAIVEYLMTWAASRGMNMNVLAAMAFDAADREQFAQLIGYSLGGFGELSYVTDETYARAEAAVPPGGKDVTDEPPFRVGQRVRMKSNRARRLTFTRAVVTELIRHAADFWVVRLKSEATRAGKVLLWHARKPCDWEPVPDVDLSIDEVATALAHAVLTGDKAAALALADRVIELCR